MKLTTLKIFHLKNMPFQKVWQAARHFSQVFLHVYTKEKETIDKPFMLFGTESSMCF